MCACMLFSGQVKGIVRQLSEDLLLMGDDSLIYLGCHIS